MEQEKLTGIVKWFDVERGFGFISRPDNKPDDFVHVSALRKNGIDFLREGDRVRYVLERNPKSGKMNAREVEVL